jgi:hypothetical protein
LVDIFKQFDEDILKELTADKRKKLAETTEKLEDL